LLLQPVARGDDGVLRACPRAVVPAPRVAAPLRADRRRRPHAPDQLPDADGGLHHAVRGLGLGLVGQGRAGTGAGTRAGDLLLHSGAAQLVVAARPRARSAGGALGAPDLWVAQPTRRAAATRRWGCVITRWPAPRAAPSCLAPSCLCGRACPCARRALRP